MDSAHMMPGEDVVAGIKADLDQYEVERAKAHAEVQWRVPVFLGLWIGLFLLIAVAFNSVADPWEKWVSTPHVFAYVLGFVGLFFVYGKAHEPATTLQKSFRQRVLPVVFGFIKDVAYRQGTTPSSFGRLPRDVVDTFNRQIFDDIITGSYEDFPFELYEATLTQKAGKSSSEIFKGIIVAFEMSHPFPGLLVAGRKKGSVTKFFRGMFGTKLEEVRSGIIPLDEDYEFRTDNPGAAQPLVAGRLAQALQWLREAWPEQPSRVAMKGGDGFLLIPVRKNFFELPPISQPLDYKAHIEPIVADLATLLATASLVRKVGARDEAPAAPEA